ncbi:hypothetical protein KIN20_027826 [Parelaphostrongylus tenuis]|uniref:Uncharacterized protein n=1 Tax=Parelaphostrongylus tenuis TaxID=148309 RepID=A0AAD5R051_PARTN|nr:hypothetical protein KIN20_027826 [Parelaphostrongylus tenuis]
MNEWVTTNRMNEVLESAQYVKNSTRLLTKRLTYRPLPLGCRKRTHKLQRCRARQGNHLCHSHWRLPVQILWQTIWLR